MVALVAKMAYANARRSRHEEQLRSSRSVVGQILATQLPIPRPARAFHPSTLASTLLFQNTFESAVMALPV